MVIPVASLNQQHVPSTPNTNHYRETNTVWSQATQNDAMHNNTTTTTKERAQAAAPCLGNSGKSF